MNRQPNPTTYRLLDIVSLTGGFVITAFIMVSLYFILSSFGVEKSLNTVDRKAFVPWIRSAFYPKQYVKLFFNFTIFFVPTLSILLSFLIKKVLRKFHIKKRTVSLSTSPSKKFRLLDRLVKKYYVFILIGMLTVVLINFGYLIETGIWVNYYHYNFIIAAINDLFQGKYLLVDTFSQYGLLYSWFLYIIFKTILPFSYMNLYLVFMIATWIYFFILFFFLKELTRSTWYSLIGLYIVMGVNTLFNYDVYPVSENYVWPGAVVLRYFFDGVVFLLIVKNTHFSSRLFHLITSFLVALALLHNIETGAALVVAFLFFILLQSRFTIILFCRKAAAFFIALISLVLLFSVYTYIGTHQLPDWNFFIRFIKLAQQGFNNAQTPRLGWYLIYVVVYFVVLTSVLERLFILKKITSWKWMVIASYALYGLLLLNYYISRSYNSNLTVVGIPGLVILIFLIKELEGSRFMWFRRIRTIFIITVVILAYISSFYLYKRLRYRWYSWNEVKRAKKYYDNRGFIMASYTEETGYTINDLLQSVASIKTLTQGSKKILLLSRYDVLILVMTEKTHFISYPMIEQIYYLSELQQVNKNLLAMRIKPQYLFIDKKNPLHKDGEILPPSYWNSLELFKTLSPFYEFVKQVGILDIYRLKSELLI